MENLKTKSAKKFMRFLKDNDAVTKYMEQIHIYCMTFDQVLKRYNKDQYIIGPFVWTNTKEGYDYWWELHEKWIGFR